MIVGRTYEYRSNNLSDMIGYAEKVLNDVENETGHRKFVLVNRAKVKYLNGVFCKFIKCKSVPEFIDVVVKSDSEYMLDEWAVSIDLRNFIDSHSDVWDLSIDLNWYFDSKSDLFVLYDSNCRLIVVAKGFDIVQYDQRDIKIKFSE